MHNASIGYTTLICLLVLEENQLHFPISTKITRASPWYLKNIFARFEVDILKIVTASVRTDMAQSIFSVLSSRICRFFYLRSFFWYSIQRDHFIIHSQSFVMESISPKHSGRIRIFSVFLEVEIMGGKPLRLLKKTFL